MTREDLENELIDLLLAAGSSKFDAARRRRLLNRKAQLISSKLARISGLNFARGKETLAFSGTSAVMTATDFGHLRMLQRNPLTDDPTDFARIIVEHDRNLSEFECGVDRENRPVAFVRYDGVEEEFYIEFLTAQSGNWDAIYERVCPVIDLLDAGNGESYTTVPPQWHLLIAYDAAVEGLGNNTENDQARNILSEAARLHQEMEESIRRLTVR